MGKAALDGLPGVSSVEKGWQGRFEVNRVIFNPQQVTIEEMENRLKRAETYRFTFKEEDLKEK